MFALAFLDRAGAPFSRSKVAEVLFWRFEPAFFAGDLQAWIIENDYLWHQKTFGDGTNVPLHMPGQKQETH